MRIDIHAVNIDLTDPLKRFAESRAWMSARRHFSRVAWIGLWLVDQRPSPDRPGLTCRIDAWLRNIGHLTVCHADTNIYVAIDIAAARLEQSIARALRQAAQRRIEAAQSDGDSVDPRLRREQPAAAMPRLAVAIERRDARLRRRRLPLLPWLRIKYGIEQVSRVTLPDRIWEGVAKGTEMADLLHHRLALSLLCWPELIVVVGRSDGSHDEDVVVEEQQRVRQIVQRIREWSVPLEVVGAWINERWEPDCYVESQELCDVPAGAEPATLDAGGDNRQVAAQEEVAAR
jgi:ribosome-associated translation inhibitor RaiA